jgi:hypothetical protein
MVEFEAGHAEEAWTSHIGYDCGQNEYESIIITPMSYQC